MDLFGFCSFFILRFAPLLLVLLVHVCRMMFPFLCTRMTGIRLFCGQFLQGQQGLSRDKECEK
jgi:hypothetical protein